jgi:FkbM family methyltransferase
MTIEHFEKKYGQYMLDNADLICSYLNSGDVFVDVGSNTGVLSKRIIENLDQLGTKLLKVILIEPIDYLYDESIKKLGGYDFVEFHKLGLSNTNEEKLFILSKINYAYNKIYDENMEIHPHEKKHIKCVKFSDWVSDNKIDFVKIDAEGHDIEIIMGMFDWLDKTMDKPYILFEGNWYPKKEIELIQLMKEKYGYDNNYFGRDILLTPKNKRKNKVII